MIGTTNFERIIRRILREGLDDLWLSELTPPAGVGSIAYPSVFTMPDGAVKLLFNDGTDIYVADIDKSLTVSSPVKLPVKGIIPSIVWDETSRRWFLLLYSVIKDRRFGFYVLSEDMKTVLASQDPLLVDGAEWNAGGHGLLLPTIYKFYAFVDGGEGTELITASWTDLRATPPVISFSRGKYPLTVEANTYTLYGGEYGKWFAHDGACPGVYMGDMLVWLLSVHDTFDRGLLLAYSVYDGDRDHFTTGICPELIIAPPTHGSSWYVSSWEYGSLTYLLGRHLTLLLTEVISGRKPRCKSYALRLPWSFLNPRNKTLVYTLWNNTSISAGEVSPAMPGFGRKTIFFTSNTAGDLTVYLDAVGRNDYKPVFTHTGITSVLTQTTYSGARFRLGFSAAGTVSAYVVVEP